MRRFGSAPVAALALALLLPLPGLAGEVVVKPGETLSEIADRYGVSVQRLMQLNGLKDAKDLWAGSRIQVPGAGGGSSSGGRTGGGSGNYTVKPGETLSEIADRYGVSVERLMQLNGLKDAKDLWAGSRIQVPGASARAAATRPSAPPPVNRNAREHKVQPGETLSEIADRYGVPVERLVALNSLSKPNELMAGDTIKLRGTPKPAVKPAVKQAVKPAAKPAPKPVATATPTTTPAVATSKPAPQPKPATTSAPVSVAAKPAAPDWRSYGPLQVDWANWQPMGGSYVAPSLNSDGQPLYLAVNCSARRLNATGQSGAWKSWDAPRSEFEEQLINDLCKAKQS
jgi:LysM repeat protein